MRADDLVPSLVRCLTDGAIRVSPRDARRWRGWALALQRTSNGQRLVELRHNPQAWPSAWERAEEQGFDPATEHHNALLFREFFHRLADDGDLDASQLAWERSLRAWDRLGETSYLTELATHLVDGVATDPSPIVAELLDPDLDFLLAELTRALRLGADEFSDVDRPLALWGWSCLDAASQTAGVNPLSSQTRSKSHEAKAFVVATATTRFRRAVDSIDWVQGEPVEVVAPFLWLADACNVFEHRENVASVALKEVIDGAWTLRKIDRDHEEVFRKLIEAGEPFADVIVSRLDQGEAFGQGSRAADYLVFCGELASDSQAKRKFYQRALELSPGHRNASLLYSYEHLVDVESLLVQLAANPSLMTKVPIVGSSVENLVRKAWGLCDEIERLYPYNSRLEETRARVKAEADRLGVELEGGSDG